MQVITPLYDVQFVGWPLLVYLTKFIISLLTGYLDQHLQTCLATPLQDFNQLTGPLPAPATGSPLVYLTASFQVSAISSCWGSRLANINVKSSKSNIDRHA